MAGCTSTALHIVDGKTHLTESKVQPDGSWKVIRQVDNYGYDRALARSIFWPKRKAILAGRRLHVLHPGPAGDFVRDSR
jgi:hypothetical protein